VFWPRAVHSTATSDRRHLTSTSWARFSPKMAGL